MSYRCVPGHQGGLLDWGGHPIGGFTQSLPIYGIHILLVAVVVIASFPINLDYIDSR